MALSVSIAVTRTLLALGPLAVEDPANGYQVFKFGPGASSWRKETVHSPYADGETLVSAVKDIQVAPIGVRVKGSTAAQAESRLGVLLDAFSQYVYYIGTIIDGVERDWLCEPADFSVGESGEFNKFHMMSKIFEVTLSVPRQPVPTFGSI